MTRIPSGSDQKLREEFEKLLLLLRSPPQGEKEMLQSDLRRMKENVFGPKVFWVTDVRSPENQLMVLPGDFSALGWLVWTQACFPQIRRPSQCMSTRYLHEPFASMRSTWCPLHSLILDVDGAP